MPITYLALGSNLGDRRKNIDDAIARLNRDGVAVLRCSTVIETEPAGGPPQGKYLNAVLKAQTDLSPRELLAVALNIEKRLGRVRTVKNGSRTIDIDILLYDDLKIDTPQLTIPHPRMQERDFVMQPLKEIKGFEK
jgi:2-amino-4-hydroxy-6-hydroxymethyldihydropteridine diphosphokinase